MNGRSLLFMFIAVLIVASFLLSYLSYNEVQHCDKIIFSLASPILIIVSFVPPMFYKVVDRPLRSYVSLLHLFVALCATVISAFFYAETFHLRELCQQNDIATTYQLIAVICFNAATILGHQIKDKTPYTELDTELDRSDL